MSAHQPKYRILQEMGHHAWTQAASPLGQQPKQTAVNRDNEHELWALIPMRSTEGNTLNDQSRCRTPGDGGKLPLQIAAGLICQGAACGASHGYQGPKFMFIIAVYGCLFGLLAEWHRRQHPE